MGQAKRRGTKEERIVQSQEASRQRQIDQLERDRKRAAEQQAAFDAMTPEEKAQFQQEARERVMRKRDARTMVTVAAMVALPFM